MAKQAEDLGASNETVEEILVTPIPIPRPNIAPTFQAAIGISSRVTYHAEVKDLRSSAARSPTARSRRLSSNRI